MRIPYFEIYTDKAGKYRCGNRLDTVKKLTELLDADEVNDGEDLEDNWGGSMLHIIELA